MAGAGIGNPSGAHYVFDGGTPRIITGYARETISGGVFVYASGASNVVTATPDTFATNDILFCKDASGGLFNGVALHTAGSNTPVAVATRGVFILQANGTVVAGTEVKCDGNNAILPLGSTSVTMTNGTTAIGRALTGAGSEGFALVDIRP